jgi:hypothetical protein
MSARAELTLLQLPDCLKIPQIAGVTNACNHALSHELYICAIWNDPALVAHLE